MSRKEFIPPTKTATAKKIKTAKKLKLESELPPKDLEDLWGAVIAISTAHNLLNNGSFPYAHRNGVGVALEFLGALHKKTLTQCVEHPKQHLIPEIATLAAAQKVANGEANAPNPAN